MATKPSTVAFLLDQMAEAGAVTARKMFGEYGVFLDDKTIALICDDRLFLKPTGPGRQLLATVTEAPPYPGAKSWFLVPEEVWDDRDHLAELARVTAGALPPPRRKASGKAGI